MKGQEKKRKKGNMSLVGHLQEFRKRLVISGVVLLLAAAVCFALIQPLAELMLSMGSQYGFNYVYLAPSEMLTSYFKLALILAAAIVSPFLLSQVWGFVAPALRKREKKAVLPALFGGFGFFLLGAVFAYFIAIPFMVQFLIKYSSSRFVTSSISVASYLDFVLGMLLVFGLIFEMPMLVFVLSRLGVLTPQLLRKVRRFAMPLIFLMAAFMTPPDVMSQFMVAIPMIGLYEVSILISGAVYKKRLIRESMEEDGEAANEDEDEDDEEENDEDE